MKYENVLNASDEQIIDIVKAQFGPIYEMRRVVRWGSPKLETLGNQNIVEHSFNSLPLAHFFWYLEGKDRGVDLQRAWNALIYHDLPEIGEGGDVLQSMKPDVEPLDSQETLNSLVNGMHPFMGRNILMQLSAFQKEEDVNVRFALASEKLEASVENVICGVERLVRVPKESLRPGMWHCWVTENRMRVTETFPVMRRFNEAMDRYILAELEQYRPAHAAE